MTTPDNPDSAALAGDRDDGLSPQARRAMLTIAVSASAGVAVGLMSLSLLGGRGPRLGLALLIFMIGPAVYWLITRVAAPSIELRSRERDQVAGEKHLRRAAARDSSTSPATLEALARSRDARTRRAVAQNSATPLSALALLGEDRDHHIAAAVCAHPRASEDLIVKVASRPEPRLRTLLLQHSDLPARARQIILGSVEV